MSMSFGLTSALTLADKQEQKRIRQILKMKDEMLAKTPKSSTMPIIDVHLPHSDPTTRRNSLILTPTPTVCAENPQFQEIKGRSVSSIEPQTVYSVYSPSGTKALDQLYSPHNSKHSISFSSTNTSDNLSRSTSITTTKTSTPLKLITARARNSQVRRASMPESSNSSMTQPLLGLYRNLQPNINNINDSDKIINSGSSGPNDNLGLKQDKRFSVTLPIVQKLIDTEKIKTTPSISRKTSFSYLDNIKKMNETVISNSDNDNKPLDPSAYSHIQSSIIRPQYENTRDTIIRRHSYSSLQNSPMNTVNTDSESINRRASLDSNNRNSTSNVDSPIIRNARGEPVLMVYTPTQKEKHFGYEPEGLSY